jgi:hypothetical protein
MAPFSPLDARKPSLGNGKQRARLPQSPSVNVSQRRLADERALWIAERQEQLSDVLDRHDDLVCPLILLYLLFSLMFGHARSGKCSTSKSLSPWSLSIPRYVTSYKLFVVTARLICAASGSQRRQVGRFSRRRSTPSLTPCI